MNQNIIAVNFNNQSLLATLVDDVPYVAIKPICENLGIAWNAQLERIKRHAVLSKGMRIIRTPSNGGIQEMLMLPIRMLNGWLFGIDANRVNENAKEAVIKYQEECFDVLANHFMPKRNDVVDFPTISSKTPASLPELLNARMTAQQKIMMLILGRYADENGKCQISIGDLAPLCGIERSTTSKNLTDLVEAGFLTVTKTRYEHGGSQPNIYTIPERFRFVSGELVNEPIAVEYQPPKGMMLIAESEFEALQKVEPIPAPQPVFSIPKNMVMISTERFIELEKYSISNEHYFRKLPAKRTNVKEMLECLDVGMNLITDALDDLELGRKDNIDAGINKILAGLLAMRRYQPKYMQADYCG